MGACSTQRRFTGETGCDALRLLFEVDRVPDRPFELDGWHGGGIPSHGLMWLEQKGGDAGELWSGERVAELGAQARTMAGDHFGIRRDRGVSRADFTTTRRFATAAEGRAFMAGMAAMEFPRLEGTRRGTPPHSVWWTGTTSRKIRNRVYDKGYERGGERWVAIRLEDQRSYGTSGRPPVERVAEVEFQREAFRRRFEPMAKAAEGVRAASFPVIAQAIADEARYGYRDTREAERLAGALVLLSGGAGEAYTRTTHWRRRQELREAGYVVVDDFMEPVEVNLGDELAAALDEFGG